LCWLALSPLLLLLARFGHFEGKKREQSVPALRVLYTPDVFVLIIIIAYATIVVLRGAAPVTTTFHNAR